MTFADTHFMHSLLKYENGHILMTYSMTSCRRTWKICGNCFDNKMEKAFRRMLK